ncbi:MAG: hypothetical protein EZS28_028758 [Streblomastix strix]|uniref:Armadillo repeat-containing protein 8 n=1 Tax=Streblomastix strix TaxID=222440 RepID=A0A5J4UYH5_9EUKA|nr:MAG: hypothetical protein EZS28_028758 [Streblomastix strix]
MKDFFKGKVDKDKDKQDQVVKKNIIDVLSELLKIHDKDEAVLLPTTHSFRMIISLRKARDLATKANSAQYLVNVLKRHINGMLAIVQYSFMSLVIMATSIECRDNCRSAHVEGVLTRCLEQYSTNAGVVRNSCICIAALIYNNEYIDCLDERMVKAMNKSIKAIKEGEHTTTLRVITAALKEASLYPQCVKKLIAGGTIDTLIALIKTHSQDKVIVALSIATLVKLSTETSSHDLFLHEDGAVVIPSLLSLYFNKSWIVVRATTLLLRNLVQSDSWKHALAEKDGFKHVIRTIAHYIRNCQSIVFVCLEVIKGILELNPVPTKVRDERVVKVLRVSEQAYYHRSRVISTLSKDCLKVLLTRDPSAADKAGTPEKEKEGK